MPSEALKRSRALARLSIRSPTMPALIVFCCIDIAWCCAAEYHTLTPKFCDLTRCRIRGTKKRELSRFKSLMFP